MNGENLRKILSDKKLLIPPYQRGYSWEKQQVEALLVDLDNFILSNKKNYYIGVVTVQKKESEHNGFEYYVVDGQQRLTTILLILSELLLDPDNSEKQFKNGENIEYLILTFLYDINKENKFRYSTENVNYEYLKTAFSTFGLNELEKYEIKNVYSKNIYNAKKSIHEWFKNKRNSEEALFKAVTEKLLFDYKEFGNDEDSEIYVIFETINKRGKPLSDLESLKNRLMYLTTLKINSNSDENPKIIIERIENIWTKIYQTLGKEIKKSLSDDVFLKEHWYMYARYSRIGERPYARDIFDLYFTSSNYINSNSPVDFPLKRINLDEINSFLDSLDTSIDNWFTIKKPEFEYHKHNKKLIKESFGSYLYKIRQLEIEFFDPIILSAFYHYSKDELIPLVKEIERYIFTLIYISERKSDYGSYDFLKKANPLFLDRNLLNEVVLLMKDYIDGDEQRFKSSRVSIENFINKIRDYFIILDANGYESWKGTKYLLQEYYQKDQDQIEILNLNDFKLVKILNIKKDKDILGEANIRTTLPKSFHNYSDKELKNLFFSIGNFVLLNKRSIHNLPKDNHLRYEAILDQLQKENPSATEELRSYNSFSGETIKMRGLNILNFMEKRWGISIPNKEKLITPIENNRIVIKRKFA